MKISLFYDPWQQRSISCKAWAVALRVYHRDMLNYHSIVFHKHFDLVQGGVDANCYDPRETSGVRWDRGQVSAALSIALE